MQRRRLLHLPLIAAAALARPALAQHEATAWPARQRWPAIEAQDLAGKTWRLADLRGRAVLLNFWASWCEPCRAEMPMLQDIAALYGEERLAVLALNYKESADTAARFVRRTDLKLPVLRDPDGAIARACGVKVFPTTLLIAPDGRPRLRVRGAVDWTGREAGGWIESLWQGAAPPAARR